MLLDDDKLRTWRGWDREGRIRQVFVSEPYTDDSYFKVKVTLPREPL